MGCTVQFTDNYIMTRNLMLIAGLWLGIDLLCGAAAAAADIYECSSNPCVNGGECKNGINQFTCECALGYEGVTCEADIDECSSNPCLNGGECKDGINKFTCECALGYEGVTCETVVTEDCTYGNSSDCIFPCNCADPNEVCDKDSGHCSQCPFAMDVEELGLNSTGPGCRVQYVFTGSSFVLDEKFKNEFFNMTHEESQKLTETLERLLNLQLNGQIEEFQFVNITMLSNFGDHIGVKLHIATLLAVDTMDPTIIQQSVKNALINVLSSGVLGQYLVKFTSPNDIEVELPSTGSCISNPCMQGNCRIEDGLNVCSCNIGYAGANCDKEYVFTGSSFVLDEKFKREFFNMAHEVSQKLTETLERLLNHQLNGNIEEFQFVNITMLSNVGNRIGVHLRIVTLSPVDTMDPTLIQQSVKNALINVLSSGLLGQYLVKFKSPDDIEVELPSRDDIVLSALSPNSCTSNTCMQGVCSFEEGLFVCLCNIGYTGTNCDKEYVFTGSSFVLDEMFKREFFNMADEESQKLTKNLEKLLNIQLNGKIEEFQFVNITMLRKVGNSIGLNISIVTLSPLDSMDPTKVTIIQQSVENALINVLSNGQLGSYFVKFTSPNDIEVEVPSTGSPPRVSAFKYIFTTVAIQTENDFRMDYIDTSKMETMFLTKPFRTKMDSQFSSELDEFQFVDVLLIRNENGKAKVDLEVVTLTSGDDIDVNAVKKCIEDILKGISPSLGVLTVHSPMIGASPIQSYVMTSVSFTVLVKFIMAYTNPGDGVQSDASLQLKDQIESEMNQLQQYVTEFQFISVVLFREEDTHTAVDIVIASLTESFHAAQAKKDIVRALQEVLNGGVLGTLVNSTSVSVGTPLKGKIPPLAQQEYAFTRASLHLMEPWKEMYNDPKHPDTQQLIGSVEEELKDAFDKRKNQEIQVTGIREERQSGSDSNVMAASRSVLASLFVASLTIVKEYNSALVEERFMNVMEEVVEDGRIGGFAVSASVVDAVRLGQTQLGELPQEFVRDQTMANNQTIAADKMIGGPGFPKWSTPLILAGGCAIGIMLLVGGMYAALKFKRRKKKQADDAADRSSDPTKKSTITEDEQSRRGCP